MNCIRLRSEWKRVVAGPLCSTEGIIPMDPMYPTTSPHVPLHATTKLHKLVNEPGLWNTLVGFAGVRDGTSLPYITSTASLTMGATTARFTYNGLHDLSPEDRCFYTV